MGGGSSNAGPINIFDTTNWQQPPVIVRGGFAPRGYAVSPLNDIAVMSNSDGTISIIDLRSSTIVNTLRVSETNLDALAFY